MTPENSGFSISLNDKQLQGLAKIQLQTAIQNVGVGQYGMAIEQVKEGLEIIIRLRDR